MGEKGQVFVVKDAGLWRDVPESDKLSHVAFCYGIMREKSKPYKNGIRAIVKFIHAGSEEEVHKRAEELAGENKNHHIMEAPIGGWLPLSVNYDQYTKEVKIQQREGQQALRAYTSDEDKKAKDEMRQIDDRREALKTEDLTLEDTDTLEYYTLQRTKCMEMERFISEGERRLVEARNKLRDVKLHLVDLDESHPEYIDLWEDELRKKRESEGVGGEKPAIINERIE